MSHPQRERIAAVFGVQQGSGYLLTPSLVITAAHLLGGDPHDAPDSAQDSGAHPVEVIVPGGVGRVGCRVLWSRQDEECDAALLLADRDLVPAERFREFSALLWGRVEDLAPQPGAHAVGYPQVQRDADGELDTEQLLGTLKPAAALLRGRHVLDSLHGAPAPLPGGGSPWSGFSGAAVFLDDRFVGVVRADPLQWRHGRVEITPASAVLRAAGFPDACRVARHVPRSVLVRPLAAGSVEEFEENFRDFVINQSSTLHIIGLSRGGEQGDTWPLDTSYLSLELLGGAPLPPEADGLGPVSQRAEQALAGHQRILIRGSAGSGKTTLLQWLATATARRALPSLLADLADCVPLLIRLRSIAQREELPSPEELLPIVARPLAGHSRALGWVTEQMRLGRVLLLVDGVDEVPEADRERTRSWLTELMAAYPNIRYVVTTRPSAVREGWLARAGFTELELIPMSQSDVAAFITKWHIAAGDDPRLPEWRDKLTAAVVAKQDLGRLATSPLMCALICALNRDRNGYLPEGRMELYSAALEMLLVRRDRERGITAPSGLRLTADQQIQLLQRLAYWLATNGMVEIEYGLALRLIESALPSMLAITGTPDQVLRQLLVRSGLLRRPSAETLDFVHRTFQDYLAAKAAVEDENLGVLVRNAHDDQWDDVLRMAVGHARPRERVKILSALLAEAEKQPRYRDRLRLLAANCLEHATELDPGIRERVTEAATTLIPPRDDETAKELATAGALVLDLLPGPDGLDDQTARAVVITALEVADSRAIPLLRRYATHPSVGVRGQLARAWERFDTREYGEQVIARLAYDDGLRFVARSAEQLAFLQHHGGRPTIECSGPLGNEDLEHLPSGIRELRIHDTPHGLDLGAILRRSAPGSLWLSNCTGEISLAPLAGSALDSLYLHWNTQLGDPGALRGADQLRTLAVAALADSPEERLAGLALPPGLTALYVGLFHTPMTELRTLLGTVPELENLFVSAERFPVRMRSPLRTLHRLRRLRVLREDLRHLQTQRPLPAVTELQLLLPTGLEALGLVAESYPNLRSLRLEGQGMRHLGPHVRRALVRLHGCEVELYHHHAPVTPSIFGIGLHFVPTITTFTIP